jgi:hypothetical protein
MIFSYGSRRLRTNAFSFCRAAVLANSEISSIDCRLSFGSLVHWRMIFRRASRCFFITSGIGTLLEVDYSGSAYQEALCHFSVSSFIVLTVMAKLLRSCSERTSSARSFTSLHAPIGRMSLTHQPCRGAGGDGQTPSACVARYRSTYIGKRIEEPRTRTN